MRCNACGKQIYFDKGIMKEDVFEAAKEWGYFSEKDTEIHRFNLCEICYDNIVSGFIIPVDKSIKKEI